MNTDKKVVIIIDGSDLIQEAAETAAAIIEERPGYSVSVIHADSFSGEDLLPSCAFFLGCAKAPPPSFVYIETLLEHINLASRPCGLFSDNSAGAEYLSSIVLICECLAAEPFLLKDKNIDRDRLYDWIQSVLKERVS